MKNNIKVIVLLFIIAVSCGCVKRNSTYYDKLADTVIGFYRSSDYEVKKIHKDDLKTVQNYLSTLTHVDHKVDLTDFINKDLQTGESNGSDAKVEDGKCYIDYSVLKSFFDNPDLSSNMEPMYVTICNGYKAILTPSDFYPDYDATISNPVYNFVQLKNKKTNDEKIYYYTSVHDGSYFKLSFIIENKKLVEIKSGFITEEELDE